MTRSSVIASCPASVSRDVSLARHTSWQVGGPAEFFAEPETRDQLEEVLLWSLSHHLPLTVLGDGTNVLAADSGVKGLVLDLARLKSFEVTELESETVAGERIIEVHAMSGMPKSELLKLYLKRRLDAAVFLSGIPGQVGGGIAMNAGVGEWIVPREFCEITHAIEVWRLESPIRKEWIAGRDIQWGYRSTKGWQPGLIVSAKLRWPDHPKLDVPDRVRAANQVRFTKQPLDMPSCGSVFANPSATQKAGQLIEQCGLKGFTIGRAAVSTKHANFVVNLGGATATEIDQVITHVQHTVHAQAGIKLRHEVVYIGEWSHES